MDLVAFEMQLAQVRRYGKNFVASEPRTRRTVFSARSTVRTGRRPSAVRLQGSLLILDTLRIFDGNSKHLKAAADADDRDTGFSEPAKLLGKTAPLKPA